MCFYQQHTLKHIISTQHSMLFSILMLWHVVILIFVANLPCYPVPYNIIAMTAMTLWRPPRCGTFSLSGIIGLLNPHHLTPLEEFAHIEAPIAPATPFKTPNSAPGTRLSHLRFLENYPDRPQILGLGELLERSKIFEGNLISIVSSRQNHLYVG